MKGDRNGLEFGETESDRQLALKLSLDLHRTGQGVSRSADSVILTACRFLKFIRNPQEAMADASLAKSAKRAVALLYKLGNSTTLGNGDRALARTAAADLNEALKLVEPEPEEQLDHGRPTAGPRSAS